MLGHNYHICIILYYICRSYVNVMQYYFLISQVTKFDVDVA